LEERQRGKNESTNVFPRRPDLAVLRRSRKGGEIGMGRRGGKKKGRKHGREEKAH